MTDQPNQSIAQRLRAWAKLKPGDMPPETMRDGVTPGNWANVLRRLHAEAADDLDKLHAEIADLRAETKKLHDRLQDDRVYKFVGGKYVREDVTSGSVPDATPR
jgi:hypothetical protein